MKVCPDSLIETGRGMRLLEDGVGAVFVIGIEEGGQPMEVKRPKN
jgi:hypothetical protein